MNIDINSIISRTKNIGAESPDDFGTFNLNNGVLHGVNCKLCNNTGRTLETRDGMLYARECDCMNLRRGLMYLRKSGLEDMIKHNTFDTFKTPNAATTNIKASAKAYAALKDGTWFFVRGTRGSGKTHICTAIAKEILESGNSLKYVLWRDLTQKLKSVINEPEYREVMDSLIKADVLYIDDFLKGSVSEPDINRAYEVINARYNLKKKKTIISSERSLEEIDGMDSAISDRIRERCRGFCFTLDSINWRRQCYPKTTSGTAHSMVSR